jgi:glycerophosphoryl diester phosphodiesterase
MLIASMNLTSTAQHRRLPIRRWRARWGFTLCCAVLMACAGEFFDETAQGADSAKPGRVVVIAHRGDHTKAPENTLAAIRRAIEVGCDYVEVDVRRTSDGALVVMHDSTVDRTTNGKGKVAELTLEEIRKLDAGSKKGKEWSAEKVPTFDEALTLCKGKIKIYVDHKSAPPAEVLAAIEKQGMLDQVVVYGSVDVLREYKKLKPSVWIMPPHPGTPERIRRLVADLKPETLDGNIREWNGAQVEAAHAAGAQVWVDNPENRDNEDGIRQALKMGVDAIQTDAPEKVIAILKKHGRR